MVWSFKKNTYIYFLIFFPSRKKEKKSKYTSFSTYHKYIFYVLNYRYKCFSLIERSTNLENVVWKKIVKLQNKLISFFWCLNFAFISYKKGVWESFKSKWDFLKMYIMTWKMSMAFICKIEKKSTLNSNIHFYFKWMFNFAIEYIRVTKYHTNV